MQEIISNCRNLSLVKTSNSSWQNERVPNEIFEMKEIQDKDPNRRKDVGSVKVILFRLKLTQTATRDCPSSRFSSVVSLIDAEHGTWQIYDSRTLLINAKLIDASGQITN